MAASAVTPNGHTYNTASGEATYVTFAASDGVLITFNIPDTKAQISLKNTSTDTTRTAIIYAGNGIQGVSNAPTTTAAANISVTIEPSTVKVIPIETGIYKFASGTYKGKVMIKDSNTTSTSLQCKVDYIV